MRKTILCVIFFGILSHLCLGQNEKLEAEIKQLEKVVAKYDKELTAAQAKQSDPRDIRVIQIKLNESKLELETKSKTLNDFIANKDFMSNLKEGDGFKFIRILDDKKISFELINGQIVKFTGNILWTGISKYDANKILRDDQNSKTCYTPTDNPSIGDFSICDTTLRLYTEDEDKRKYYTSSCTNIEYNQKQETAFCAVKYSNCKLALKLPIARKGPRKYYVIYLGTKLKKTDIINTNDKATFEGELYYKYLEGTNIPYFYLDKWVVVK